MNAIAEEKLSQTHHSTGALYPEIINRDLDAYRLPQSSLDFFHDNGYVPNWQILDQNQILKLQESVERILNGSNSRYRELIDLDGNPVEIRDHANDGKALPYFQGAWTIDENFHDLIFHPAITVPVSQLLGTQKVRFWHDQFFYKPAGNGGNVCWHQDYSYWRRTRPSNHVTVWIGLDDSTPDNGCLNVIPGSHKWELLPDIEIVNGDMSALAEYLNPQQVEAFKRETPIIQNKGQCSFHHDHLVHGSYPNHSSMPRRACVLNFMGAETVSADGSAPLMPGAPVIPEGELVEGDIFPIVLNLEI